MAGPLSATLRPMQPPDLPWVMAVQQQCYVPEMVEDLATLQARLHAAPQHAWVAEHHGTVCAYLVGYRSVRGSLSALGATFAPTPKGDCLYLHDLAVAPSAKGLGLGPRLVRHALQQAQAQGLAHAALVSVQDSRVFWEKQGFQAWQAPTPEQQALLATYSGPAWYMTQALSGPH